MIYKTYAISLNYNFGENFSISIRKKKNKKSSILLYILCVLVLSRAFETNSIFSQEATLFK